MTNSELQIDFQTKFNRLSGSSYLGFSLEEIDWYLNEAMFQKVNKALDRKFNKRKEDFLDTRKQLEDIEELFTELDLPIIKVNDTLGQSLLPPDFLHLHQANAYLNSSCSYDVMTTSNKNIKYIVLPLPNVDVTSWTFNLTISAISTPVFNLSHIQNVLSGNILADENHLFVNRILQYVNSQSLVKVYWENYGDIYQKNSFIFVYEGTGSLTNGLSTLNATLTTINPISLTLKLITYTNATSTISCRIEDSESLGILKKNPFTRSNRKSPIVSYFRGSLRIEINKFNVNLLNILYIRKPRTIDYRINQSIELGSTLGQKYQICQDIVDLAVANAAARSGNSNSQILDSKSI